MAKAYQKRRGRARGPQVVDRAQVLGGRVSIEVPVSVAEIIEGASREAEQLAGEAGLLIMKAVMDAEVESLAGPKLDFCPFGGGSYDGFRGPFEEAGVLKHPAPGGGFQNPSPKPTKSRLGRAFRGSKKGKSRA
jgi:hypothetical protein